MSAIKSHGRAGLRKNFDPLNGIVTFFINSFAEPFGLLSTDIGKPFRW
jgi:hypothetical protein